MLEVCGFVLALLSERCGFDTLEYSTRLPVKNICGIVREMVVSIGDSRAVGEMIKVVRQLKMVATEHEEAKDNVCAAYEDAAAGAVRRRDATVAL